MIYVKLFNQRFQKKISNWKQFPVEIFGQYVTFLVFFFLALGICRDNSCLAHITKQELAAWFALVVCTDQTFFGLNYSKTFNMIRSGKLQMELLKPYQYYRKLFAEALADFLSMSIMYTIPFYALIALSFGVVYPPNFLCLVLFLISFMLGFVVISGILILLQAINFWPMDQRAVVYVFHAAFRVCCGMLVPYFFMPKMMVKILMCTPFGYIWNAPIQIYFGNWTFSQSLAAIGGQIFWIAVVFLVVRVVFRVGQRRLIEEA